MATQTNTLGKRDLEALPGVHLRMQDGTVIALEPAASVYMAKSMPTLVLTLLEFQAPWRAQEDTCILIPSIDWEAA